MAEKSADIRDAIRKVLAETETTIAEFIVGQTAEGFSLAEIDQLAKPLRLSELNRDQLGRLLIEIGISNPPRCRFEHHGPSLDELPRGRNAVEISFLVLFDIRGRNPCCLTLVLNRDIVVPSDYERDAGTLREIVELSRVLESAEHGLKIVAHREVDRSSLRRSITMAGRDDRQGVLSQEFKDHAFRLKIVHCLIPQ